jgi:hypothetical protein
VFRIGGDIDQIARFDRLCFAANVHDPCSLNDDVDLRFRVVVDQLPPARFNIHPGHGKRGIGNTVASEQKKGGHAGAHSFLRGIFGTGIHAHLLRD